MLFYLALRHFLSFILISLILLNEAHTLIVYVSFKIHQDYIVNNLCVMKDAEENTCQGSCHLKRKLDFGNKEDSNNKEKAVLELVKRYSFYRCAISGVKLAEELADRELTSQRIFNEVRYDDDFVYTIFHPPKS